MTIASITNRYAYSGNDVTTAFAYSSMFLANADLVVVLVSSAGLETVKTLTTHYTVTGAGTGTGTVTMLTAPATGETLVIYGDPSLTQGVDLVEGDNLDPNAQIETPLDRLTLITQRLDSRVDRAVRLPEGTSASVDPKLPVPAGGQTFGWNATATELVNIELESGTSLVSLAASSGSSLMGHIAAGDGAVATTTQAKQRERVTVQDYGTAAVATTAFTKALARLSALGGGVLKVPYAEYDFAITGDSSTILIPSNVALEIAPGTIFNWSYWGSPLFGIINKTNVHVIGDALFKWAGTFGTTTGSRDAFSYGLAIAAYEWCAHIACMGSEHVKIQGLRCEGDTTSNTQNIFISAQGKSTGAKAKNVVIEDIYSNDVSQTILMSGLQLFKVKDIRSDRYSQASNALYGPGHVVYCSDISDQGEISNISDAATQIDAYTDGGHTVAAKSCTNVRINNISSNRPEGILTLGLTSGNTHSVDVSKLNYYSADTTGGATSATGNIYISPTVGGFTYNNVSFEDVNLKMTTGDRAMFNCNVAAVTDAVNFKIRDLRMTKEVNGAGDNSNFLTFLGTGWDVDCTVTNMGTQNKPMVSWGTSLKSNIVLRICGGTQPIPRLNWTGSNSNKVTIINQSNRLTNFQEGNTAQTVSLLPITNMLTANLGVTTDPTFTVQLPAVGKYLLDVSLISSDNNHGRGGLYQIVFDDAATNDYTTATLIGSQYSKGSTITVLGVSVSATGLVTVTSTASSTTWIESYGYTLISAVRLDA